MIERCSNDSAGCGKGGQQNVQGLIYLFVAICGAALAAAAYFSLGFTPIEAGLLGLLVITLALLLLERTLRRRNEKRLERGIDDLSRLLSTDAQAGHALSQRVNALTDIDAGARLDVVEADMSVLGTVVRQLAEAVAELEMQTAAAAQAQTGPQEPEPTPAEPAPREPILSQPAISPEMLREALDDDRLAFYMQPVITLPQRRTHGYDLRPRLIMEDGELADAEDFMPHRGEEDLVRRIERQGLEEALTQLRRARITGQPSLLYVPFSKATLSHKGASQELIALVSDDRALASFLALLITERDWRILGPVGRAAIADLHAKGVRISVCAASSLRLDFGQLASLGVSSVRTDAARFVEQPETLTDFMSEDVADYLARFGVDLIIDEIRTEQQILSVLEDGVRFAQGDYISKPTPVRSDLLVRRQPQPEAQRASGA